MPGMQSDPSVRVNYSRNPDRHYAEDDGIRVTVPMDTGRHSLVTYLYGHEYESGGKTYRIPAATLTQATEDLDALATNRGIRGRLIWREVLVSVSEWSGPYGGPG